MLSYNNGAITCSYGDSFAIRFTLRNYILKEGDVATFTIKDTETKKIVLQATIDEAGLSQLDFVFSSVDMKSKVPVGSYIYDMFIKDSSNWVYTTNFSNTLEIVEVAHYE